MDDAQRPVAPSRTQILRIALLGPPLVERDGEQVSMDTRKAVALLAYLAVTGRAARRDALGFLLWPDSSHERARAALRRTLSTLRTGLGPERLRTDRETVELDLSDAVVDVDVFTDALGGCSSHTPALDPSCAWCREALERATALYRGDFLAGFTLRDSAEFDAWQLAEADALRARFTGALQHLTDGRAASGDLQAAKAHARRWLAVDPLNEAVHRRLMLLHAWSDDRSAALRQYRQCVGALESDLGVGALPETTELYHAIREGRPPSPPPPEEPTTRQDVPSARGARPWETPLVGRDGETDFLLRSWRDVGPDGRFVVIEGEAGIGKTRLAEELLAAVRAEGRAVLETRCHQDESALGFGVVTDLLARAAEDPDRLTEIPDEYLAEATRLLPELASARPRLATPPSLDSPGGRTRFFEAVGQILRAAVSRNEPGVVFVDDLHWADEASLDVLAYLARRLAGRPFLFVVAWRTELVGTTHRLRRLLADLSRSRLAVQLPLERLDRRAVLELVRRALPGADEDLAGRLFHQTEGLPLFCVEYLAAHDAGDGEESIPAGVRGLLRSRLAPLTEPARQVLTTAAVIGREFDLALARDTSGRSEEETVTALEELTAHGLVVEAEDGTYDFGHARLRAVLYEETSLARRRLLHRRAADALERSARPRHAALAGLIAAHLAQAGAAEEAAERYREAGEHARSLYANAEALEHFRRALALGHPDRSGLHQAIGDLLTLTGDYSDALDALEAAAALAPDPPTLARIEHHLGRLHQRLGDHASAESHLAAALADLPDEDEAGRSRVLADRSLTALHRSETENAARHALQALALAQEGGEPLALAQARNILGVVARRSGDLDAASRYLEESLEAAVTLPDPSARISALNNLALVLGDRGDVDGGLELALEALDLCTPLGDRHREAALQNNVADLLRAAGREEEAMNRLKRAAKLFSEIGEPDQLQPEIWKLVDW